MKVYNIILSLLVIAMTACTMTELQDPIKGNITLTTDWSKRTTGINIPESYTVILGTQTLHFKELTNQLPELNAGIYPIYVYNTPEKISINGNTVTVNTSDKVIDPLPDWFFSATSQVIYADFKVETIKVIMIQHVRQLSIDLTITQGDLSKIKSLKASLSGIANSHDFKTNIHSGKDLSLSPTFLPTDARSSNKLTATVRILGITNEAQKLNLDITLANGTTQKVESDVSKLLTNFNTDKHIPLHISANLNLPSEVGFSATISDWKAVNSSSGIAQ